MESAWMPWMMGNNLSESLKSHVIEALNQWLNSECYSNDVIGEWNEPIYVGTLNVYQRDRKKKRARRAYIWHDTRSRSMIACAEMKFVFVFASSQKANIVYACKQRDSGHCAIFLFSILVHCSYGSNRSNGHFTAIECEIKQLISNKCVI